MRYSIYDLIWPEGQEVMVMARKRGKRVRRKGRSLISYARMGGYAVAKGAPMVRIYTVHAEEGPSKALNHVLMNQLGMRPDGSFDWNIVKEQWAPVAVVGLIDFAASKVGLYRHLARVFRR